MDHRSLLPDEPIVPQQAEQPRQLSIEQAMTLAGQLQGRGQLQQAEGLVRQILAQQPRHAHALHLLGVIAHQVGKTELAVELIGQAIAEDDAVALFHCNLCEMYRRTGRLEQAIAHGERAVELEPRTAAAHSNLGIACFDSGNFEQAEACQRRALAIDPGLPQALNNLGSIMRELERPEEAINWYRRACTAAPDYLEPLNNLGSVLVSEERFDEAIEVLAKALAANPRYADAHCNIGYAFKGTGQADQAGRHFRTALEIRPDYPEAHLGISKLRQEQQDFNGALEAGLRAVELAPDNADAHASLAGIYAEREEESQAVASYRQALALKDEMPTALLGLGNLQMQLGDMEQAGAFFTRALQHAGPDDPAPRFYLTQLNKVRPGCANMAALAALEQQAERLSEQKRITLHYALGKCYDDTGDKDRAMEHFLAGAELKRKRLHYDSAAQEQTVAEVLSALDQGCLDRLRGAGNDSQLPIFVLGMPRSGTTLTEQIIASHPEVHGAGELRDLFQIAYRPLPADGQSQPFPFNLRHLSPEVVQTWAADYLARMQGRAPDARRITDKMPGNYLLVGLIHLLMPKAKIIHVRRNPVDTCVSTFNRLFQHGQEHTYDLTELGRNYRTYLQVMDHWRRVLPAGTLYEIRYEELVADTERQARGLLDYCGLSWDERCLDFHNNKRKVRTASVTQVRQPIYRSSVERWRAYEAHLGPLLDALGDAVQSYVQTP